MQNAAWGVWETEAAVLHAEYVHMIATAGGIPVMLPPVGTDTRVLERLDALIISGGSDVDPSLYNQKAHDTTQFQPWRDAHEFALIRGALATDLPLLGICRGMQVLNTALGGTLYQHLPEVIGHTDYQPSPGVYGSVEFTTEPDSLIAKIYGDRGFAPCYHHQAVATVGQGLRVTAQAADGTIEALESEASGTAWALGVQWHPEHNPEDIRLFSALVRAATERMCA